MDRRLKRRPRQTDRRHPPLMPMERRHREYLERIHTLRIVHLRVLKVLVR